VPKKQVIKQSKRPKKSPKKVVGGKKLQQLRWIFPGGGDDEENLGGKEKFNVEQKMA